MVNKSKSKGDASGPSVNETILRECHQLYVEEKTGLISIAEDVGIHLLAPRKKITVMLIGNHSAGKSSFINWYIEEKVQRTGVAIETQGFSIVTSGRKRESLTGNATLHLYEHLQPLQNLEGVVDYMNTEVTTSKQKKFNLVNFIDTPGLVDGDMKYPFDVNKAIMWLGENIADLVFVFFDPIGQALCKRTLNIVERLSDKNADKIKFFLSKADEAGGEGDRQRVMMQIVQELCKRPSLNRTAFDMSTIYVPNMGRETTCVNQIDHVCKEVEKTIASTIQNTLNTLEKECNTIADKIDYLIQQDDAAKSHNFKANTKGLFLVLSGLVIPLIYMFNMVVEMCSDETIQYYTGEQYASQIRSTQQLMSAMQQRVPSWLSFYLNLILVSIPIILFITAYLSSKSLPTFPRRRKKDLERNRLYVQEKVKTRKEELYKTYLKQSVSAYDL